jgi:hypothetical protein
MENKQIVKLGIIGVVALLLVVFLGTALSYRSDCVALEAGIKAQYDQNKNNYDNMWKSFREQSQVASMYADDLKKVFDSAMQGRYGENGSRAVLQFISEHNPQLSPEVYTQLQRSIQAGRQSFMADQRQLIDKKREYETVLNSNRAAFVNWMFHFPHIDLSKFGIVTSDRTEDTFQRGRDNEVQLR